jgi:hypothetical protein
MSKPQYKNDCKDCVFLDQDGAFDLYYCKISKRRRTGHAATFFTPLVVAVNNEENFGVPVPTVPELVKERPTVPSVAALGKAFNLARQKGLIPDNFNDIHVVALADEFRLPPQSVKALLSEKQSESRRH